MDVLSYFNIISSLTFDIEDIEEPGEQLEEEPEEAADQESEEQLEEEPEEAADQESEVQLEEESEETPGEESEDVNYITTVSENNISQIDINKNTIDVFLIAAVLGAVLGFIFLQRIKSV